MQSNEDVTPRDRSLKDQKSKLQLSDHVVPPKFGLQRQLGLAGGIAIIAGNIIGSGIFISPKGVLAGTGSVGLCLILWVVCGLITLCGSMCLAELGTMMPKSGGEYIYVLEAYGGPIAFIHAWTANLFVRPSAIAILSLTSAEYTMASIFNDGCGPAASTIRKLTAAAFILTICAVNIHSVKLANRMGVVFTSAKILSLCIIVVAGFVKLGQGYTEHLTNAFENTETQFSQLALAFYSGMWAYDGWVGLNSAAEEVLKPSRNLPLAILISIPMVTTIYVLVNISYFTVLSPEQVLASPAVAVTWAEEVMPSFTWIFPLLVGVSTFGAAHAVVFSGGRQSLAAAREGHMPEVLSMIHVDSYTPLPSLVFTSSIALLMIFPAGIETLINFFSFSAWLFYGMSSLSLIILRWKLKDMHRPFKVSLVFPCIMVLVSAYLVIGPIVDDPHIEFLYAFLAMLSGWLVYIPLVHFKLGIPFMGKITQWLQLLIQVAPARYEKLT